MEASINGVRAGTLPSRWHEPTPPAPVREPAAEAAPAATGPSVELAAWFDRNGDGRIDTTTWVVGGDAFLPVDKRVSELLDRSVTRPHAQLAAANAIAVNAYRRYGAPSQPRNS